MDTDLRSRYTAEIQAELDSIASGRERIIYVCDHLEEYVDRWVSASALPSFTMEDLLQSGLFIIVLVAIELIDNELQGTGRAPSSCGLWQEFATFAQHLDPSGSKEDVAPLLQGKCCHACRELRAL